MVSKLVIVADGTSEHTGSTIDGPISGTLTVGSNSFFSIGGQLVMVDDGTMEILSHRFASSPDQFHDHSFIPDSLQQNYFLIEGRPVILEGDIYGSDATEVNSAGSNTFFEVEV